MPRTYKLLKPVQLGEQGAPVTELTFREEIVAGDMRGIAIRENMLFDDVLKLASRLCGQPEPLLNKLSFPDFQEVAGIVSGFMEAGPTTGTKQ